MFAKNIKALEAIDLLTAIELRGVKANEKFETYIDSDPVNINFINKQDFQPMFSGKPSQETLKKVQELTSLQLYPHLYFFGVGNGVLYRLLLNSNEQLKHLVVIEPEPEILYNVLHLIDFSQEILNRRIEFHLFKNIDKITAEYIFGHTTSTLYSRLYELRIFNNYYNRYIEEIITLNRIFVEVIESIVISMGNDANDSVVGLQHQLLNMKTMIESPTYRNFVQKAKTSATAIIVSTGPSLHKQLPILKDIAPFVTIFCIDASFPILTKAGIKPDVVLTLERVKESAKFYTDTPKKAQDGVTFLITSIAHKDTLNAINKGTKILPMRPFPYTFYFNLIEYGYVGVGMSAANMAYEVIRHAQFDNIVFIGQDLAYGKDGTSHSKGAVYGEREITTDTMATNKDMIMLDAYGGNGKVQSTYVWRLFLKYLELEIAKTPGHIRVINATEGGVRIHGAEEFSFKEVAASVDRSHTKEPINVSRLSTAQIKKNMNKAQKRIDSILSSGYKQKAKLEKIFLEICATTEELERLNKTQQLDKINFKKLDRLVEKINKAKDGFINDSKMRIFDNIVQSYIIHQEMELAKISTRLAHTDMDLKVRQIDWIYAHRYWFFSLAGGIDTTLEVIKNAASSWMKIDPKYNQIQTTVETKAPKQETTTTNPEIHNGILKI
ncbi:motility accessory factor [Helicobacter monodelphidis]|nr:motility accessory factor [Helicobacter sp. 15-1451]